MKFIFAIVAALFLTTACASTGVTTLTDETYAEGVKGITGFTLFSADWCPACREFKPVWEELAKEYGDRLTFRYVNTDESEKAASKISTIPTVVAYVNGVPMTGRGNMTKEQFKEFCEALLKYKENLDTEGF